MKPDFEADQTEILWNPKAPAFEREKWEPLLDAATREHGLKAHFWIGTSGSSGRSKWVALSKKAILASAEAVNRHLGIVGAAAGDRWIHVLPGFHVGGLGIWARSHLSGVPVVNSGAPFPIWDPHFFTELVQKNSGTLSALVPTQIFDLVRAGLRAPESMRAIVVGGGNLNPALYAEARKLGWPVLPSYGLTECASQVATASLSSLEQDGYPELRLLSHVEVDAAASGARLRIRSQALLTGYLLETGSGAVFTDPKQNGWFTTEDLGSVTDGVLRVQGREGSFVKMGGESVDFARLERIFEEARLATGFAGDAMLVAVVDERLGHVTGVVVGEDREFAEEQLAALLEGFNQRVLPVERIRQVRRVPVIPRSALGKPLRN